MNISNDSIVPPMIYIVYREGWMFVSREHIVELEEIGLQAWGLGRRIASQKFGFVDNKASKGSMFFYFVVKVLVFFVSKVTIRSFHRLTQQC